MNPVGIHRLSRGLKNGGSGERSETQTTKHSDRSERADVLQLSQISKRAPGWVDQGPSHAATPSSWLMN